MAPTTPNTPDRAIIFDSETHSKIDPRVIETAYLYVDADTLRPVTEPHIERFNPGIDIAYGALASHHILPEELQGLPSSDTFELPSDVRYVIGHNIGFDLGAIGNPAGIKAIDTLSLAQKAWPNLDSHTQSALYYWIHQDRGMPMSAAREVLKNAHSAGTDIQINALILDRLYEAYAPMIEKLPITIGAPEVSLLESLHIISQAASIPLVMGFGKHEGMKPWETPESYRDWYCGVEDPKPQYVLSMRQGGDTPEGIAAFKAACLIFGDAQQVDEAPELAQPVARSPQRRFSFG